MTRILQAARLQLVAWPVRLGWPWFIMTIAFVANLALFASFGDVLDRQITGGLLSIYVVELIFCAQSITQVFPLALGLSVTRRSFYLASILLMLSRAVVFGTVLWGLKLLEDATHGWGLSLIFFGVPALGQPNPVLQVVTYVMLFVLVDLVGIFGGVVVKRWGLNGMLTLCVVATLAASGAVALVTWQRQWAAIGTWLADQSAVALIVGWPVLLAAALAAGGYVAIRRATLA